MPECNDAKPAVSTKNRPQKYCQRPLAIRVRNRKKVQFRKFIGFKKNSNPVVRVYFARDYIFSMVPTKFFGYIPAYFFEFDVYLFCSAALFQKGRNICLKIPF